MSAIFANHLAQLRHNAGISQREAAAALQVSQALLSHYEKGIREPGLDFVARAADYYGVSADFLLGHGPERSTPRFPPRAEAPSRYVLEMERELRDSLDIILDMLSRSYDPSVFCYASIYLSEVLYELVRHFSRVSEQYDAGLFCLTDEGFDSGAVVSDLTWVRAQYIMAIKQFGEKGAALPSFASAELERRYGDAFLSLRRLLHMVGHRVSRQDLAESMISSELFTPRAPVQPQTITPKEEDSL